ncbi:siderophore-interacting protein [Undibacterium sp. TS12]|uniref:siderophore-interacting protein n=1 Tax=Undibacterium sp. TS12 TaxID=2908202 RepID=UPI001F4C9B22|nr:siderophore-interacting protein [Undibacterium sp. TS12]MCH8621482.1 siderophore-interacting protein [Undibacterium sp. TS12]
MSIDLSTSRVQRIRHEIKRRDLQVVRVESPSPQFRRITLSGSDLPGFISASFDDHVKLILNADSEQAVRRDYTPRHYDAVKGELVLEFSIHGDGPAASWAAQAAAGQTITIAGPRGSLVIPTDYDWHLLAGDETAIPAIARRLEELPAGAKVTVILLAEASERRQFSFAANVSLLWVETPEELLAMLRAWQLPEGEGYAWCAGEASMMAAARRILAEEKGHPGSAMRVAAYWKRGLANHHENLEG